MKRINFNLAYEKVGEIAESVNQTYYSVRIEKNSKNGIEISSYINGFGISKSCDNVKDLIKYTKEMVSPKELPETVNSSISNIII